MKRRKFFESVGLGALGTLAAACGSSGPESARHLLAFAERRNEKLERWLYDGNKQQRVPRGVDLTGDRFPRYWVSTEMPVWDESVRGVWSLEIGGAVRTPMTLSLEQLVALPSITDRHPHYCVEGWTARAEWRGVRVSDLAKLVEPTADAQYVDFDSFDSGYHESWDMESAMHPQTMVVYATDGRYLNASQGAPARVHSPVKLGYKNTKYLTRILFLPNRTGGYWSDLGYEWYAGV